LLVELRRAHRGQCPKVAVEASGDHPQLAHDPLNPQRRVDVSPKEAMGMRFKCMQLV
jgi:hypothetical protein